MLTRRQEETGHDKTRQDMTRNDKKRQETTIRRSKCLPEHRNKAFVNDPMPARNQGSLDDPGPVTPGFMPESVAKSVTSTGCKYCFATHGMHRRQRQQRQRIPVQNQIRTVYKYISVNISRLFFTDHLLIIFTDHYQSESVFHLALFVFCVFVLLPDLQAQNCRSSTPQGGHQ